MSRKYANVDQAVSEVTTQCKAALESYKGKLTTSTAAFAKRSTDLIQKISEKVASIKQITQEAKDTAERDAAIIAELRTTHSAEVERAEALATALQSAGETAQFDMGDEEHQRSKEALTQSLIDEANIDGTPSSEWTKTEDGSFTYDGFKIVKNGDNFQISTSGGRRSRKRRNSRRRRTRSRR
jgi:uncharacterized membrane protein YccC